MGAFLILSSPSNRQEGAEQIVPRDAIYPIALIFVMVAFMFRKKKT